jgi:hypothetical protein
MSSDSKLGSGQIPATGAREPYAQAPLANEAGRPDVVGQVTGSTGPYVLESDRQKPLPG